MRLYPGPVFQDAVKVKFGSNVFKAVEYYTEAEYQDMILEITRHIDSEVRARLVAVGLTLLRDIVLC
jgi:hypothetical protein